MKETQRIFNRERAIKSNGEIGEQRGHRDPHARNAVSEREKERLHFTWRMEEMLMVGPLWYGGFAVHLTHRYSSSS